MNFHDPYGGKAPIFFAAALHECIANFDRRVLVVAGRQVERLAFIDSLREIGLQPKQWNPTVYGYILAVQHGGQATAWSNETIVRVAQTLARNEVVRGEHVETAKSLLYRNDPNAWTPVILEALLLSGFSVEPYFRLTITDEELRRLKGGAA